jgi:hypothetical protein
MVSGKILEVHGVQWRSSMRNSIQGMARCKSGVVHKRTKQEMKGVFFALRKATDWKDKKEQKGKQLRL